MILDKKIFTGGLNSDDDPKLMAQDDYLNMENCRVAGSESSKDGRVEFLRGMNLINSGRANDVTVGATIDYENRRILFFNYNPSGSAIFCFDNGVTYTVLQDSDIDLDISSSRVFARVVNGLLYWIGTGEPRKINIDSGIKKYHPSYVTTADAYVSPLSYTSTTVVKKTYNTPLFLEKKYDATYENNFIKDMSMMFFVRLTYKDGETSVFSTGSRLANFNYFNQNYNYITVSFPAEETFEQDVKIIELVVRYMDSGKFFVIKSWDKSVASELTEINNHNSGTQNLTFDFYGDITGYAVAQTEPFHSVPLNSKAIEVARNRLFLGNNLMGYDTPTKTSLTSSVSTVEDGGDLIATWYHLHIDIFEEGFRTIVGEYDVWYAKVDGHDPSLYYIDAVVYPAVPPSTLNISTLTPQDYSTNSLSDLVNFIVGDPSTQRRFTTETGGFTSSIGDASGAVTDGMGVFKSNGSYHIGVVFYDQYRRRCGVVTTDSNKLVMPSRTYNQTVYNSGINWELSNTDSLNEIPDWAYYYQIVRTENLNTRFFIQARTNDVTYVLKAADGTYSYSDTYSINNYGLAIDISSLASFGIGYNFNEGDLLIFYQSPSSPAVTYKIIGQEGAYVFLTLDDLGSTASVKGIYEIYTPYKRTEFDFFYEVSECFPVANPGGATRQYSTTSGTLSGDVYLVLRDLGSANEYYVEAMSSNDKFWRNWYTDCYGPNLITKQGQVRKGGFISYSDKYIPGTSTNGLSAFYALSQQDVPLESGAVQSLMLTTKTQEDGSVMLAICENEPLSLYLGEVQLNTTQGVNAIVTSDGVIGSINSLRGRNGTINPGSVYEYNGVVYWWDARNGEIVQYSLNGIDVISKNKLMSFWANYGRRYSELRESGVSAISGFSDVLICVDPVSKELLVSIPSVESTGYSGTLDGFDSVPSYASSIDDRYNFYDGKSKTIAYSLIQDRWKYSMTFNPETFIAFENSLFAFKGGSLYRMNASENYNSFFGVQHPARVCFVSNPDPIHTRSLLTVSLESNIKPSFTHIQTDYPNVQSTDLSSSDYDMKEGVYYADLKRDRLSPNISGSAEAKMHFGDRIRGVVPYCMVEFSTYSSPLRLNFVNIGARVSSGHKV